MKRDLRLLRRRILLRLAAAMLMLAPLTGSGCSRLLTTAPAPGDQLDAPLDGLSADERAGFLRGDAEFARAHSMTDGLGPIFNEVSCAGCHSGDGRGSLANILTRFSMGADLLLHLGGPQLQDRAIPGATPERLPPGVEVSRRLPPPVFGVGLLEAIPADSLVALADPLDADGDGISGRVHWVTPPEFMPTTEPGGGAGLAVGRFGRKAQTSTLLQQTVDAYHQDMGITTDFRPVENTNPTSGAASDAADRVADPELPAHVVRSVVTYLRLLAPPAPGAMTSRRTLGRERFLSAGCGGCHVPTLRTGPSASAALARRDVVLYSDLLLHDMGDGLADGRPDGDASGREWRTTPLWGLRVARDFMDGQLFLLHDGRARSVEQAIRLHGGEARSARDVFVGLSADERAALLDFVESR